MKVSAVRRRTSTSARVLYDDLPSEQFKANVTEEQLGHGCTACSKNMGQAPEVERDVNHRAPSAPETITTRSMADSSRGRAHRVTI